MDANILVRAVLGYRVTGILETYGPLALFCVPSHAIIEARRHIPVIAGKRHLDANELEQALEALLCYVEVIRSEVYARLEVLARERLARRDEDDWPILACALVLSCPIWTEDRDFFGCGVATWTTDRVEIFLKSARQP